MRWGADEDARHATRGARQAASTAAAGSASAPRVVPPHPTRSTPVRRADAAGQGSRKAHLHPSRRGRCRCAPAHPRARSAAGTARAAVQSHWPPSGAIARRCAAARSAARWTAQCDPAAARVLPTVDLPAVSVGKHSTCAQRARRERRAPRPQRRATRPSGVGKRRIRLPRTRGDHRPFFRGNALHVRKNSGGPQEVEQPLPTLRGSSCCRSQTERSAYPRSCRR